jgi:diaminopropionate ammonia-lyase
MGAARVVINRAAGKLLPAPSGGYSPLAFHRTLPGYAPTPLLDTPVVAERLGVARVWVKDESHRMTMPSFKILGASWASYRAVCELLALDPDPPVPLDRLRASLAARGPLTLVAATDGNHGQAVARVARLLGVSAHILVPGETATARRDSIAREGAEVTVVRGTYDNAVARSAELADSQHVVISDTSWPGYEQVPAWAIEGYATIGIEMDAQLAELHAPPPDVVVVQVGVGAFAAAMVRWARQYSSTRVIGVEPALADCVTASIEAGELVEIPGPHSSIMAGLNCGRPSFIAWPVISRGLDVLIAIDDEPAREAMRLLARAGITSGESGAAGLGGLLFAREALNLGSDTTVLLVCTEGATDPDAYERTVGHAAPAA